MNEQETVLLDSFCGDLGLEIVFAGKGRVTLTTYSVSRPGLQLAGFFKYFDSTRILVLGNTEYEFLRSLPVEVRQAQSVNGPLAVLNDYYDVYVTQPDDAKWRLDNMHEVYLDDMHSKYVYPNVFMSIDDTNRVSQLDTDIKKYAEQKKADWILNGGIEEDWDSYLQKMEDYGLSEYLAIKQKYFDKYQESLSEVETTEAADTATEN